MLIAGLPSCLEARGGVAATMEARKIAMIEIIMAGNEGVWAGEAGLRDSGGWTMGNADTLLLSNISW